LLKTSFKITYSTTAVQDLPYAKGKLILIKPWPYARMKMSRGALTNGCHVDGHPRCSRDNERGDAYVLMYEVAERKQKISPQQISDLRKQISLAPAT
jgi:hypothetical protein